MVNGEELRQIAGSILTVLDGGRVRSLDDLKQLVGMKVPFPNRDVFEVYTGDSGSLLDTKTAIKISYSRPDYGTVVNTSSNQEDNFTLFILKTNAEVFGYDSIMGDPYGPIERMVYQQIFPGADFEVLRRGLEMLTDKKYYIAD